ncbi:hypothetical protein [Saccharopolyspora sp. CA-218241]|uniref:hypothetical protein n=1 Tax=Saccharopolyspora sp. CA-218241 TaxID=3240027 RepID=UPI003D990021
MLRKIAVSAALAAGFLVTAAPGIAAAEPTWRYVTSGGHSYVHAECNNLKRFSNVTECMIVKVGNREYKLYVR